MPPNELRPVPAWVRIWAIVTVVLTFVLLALGGFVTSFRVGMADPVWPTEPWYLISNTKWEFGFVVEHTHRVAGWIVGGAVIVLAVAVWWTEPNRKLRLAGLVAMAVLVLAYGEFHRGMGSVWTELKATAASDFNLDPRSANYEAMLAETHLLERVKSWPTMSGIVTLLAAIVVIACGVVSGLANVFGGWLRCVTIVGLVAVMVQGLLGGFRVFFNALAGSNLAAIHGAFGQVAFCVLVAVVMLAAPRRAGDALSEHDAEEYSRWSWYLVGLLFIQLLWAVMLRHGGSALSQRLHLLTAFAIATAIVALVARIHQKPEPRRLLLRPGLHLIAILVLQVLLGVEAYLGKFAAVGPQAQTLPELRPVMKSQAAMRTAHQLLGCGLLASAVALAIRAGRRPLALGYQEALENQEIPVVAAMALNQTAEQAVFGRAPDAAVEGLKPPDGGVIR